MQATHDDLCPVFFGSVIWRCLPFQCVAIFCFCFLRFFFCIFNLNNLFLWKTVYCKSQQNTIITATNNQTNKSNRFIWHWIIYFFSFGCRYCCCFYRSFFISFCVSVLQCCRQTKQYNCRCRFAVKMFWFFLFVCFSVPLVPLPVRFFFSFHFPAVFPVIQLARFRSFILILLFCCVNCIVRICYNVTILWIECVPYQKKNSKHQLWAVLWWARGKRSKKEQLRFNNQAYTISLQNMRKFVVDANYAELSKSTTKKQAVKITVCMYGTSFTNEVFLCFWTKWVLFFSMAFIRFRRFHLVHSHPYLSLDIAYCLLAFRWLLFHDNGNISFAVR